MLENRFTAIVDLIKNARNAALKTVNKELINLYWNIGEYIHKRVESTEWGQSIVKELAEYIQRNEPDLKGFSDKNLWRMKQFYEVYKDSAKLSALVREISWSHNLAIFSRCQSPEEREFYLKLSKEENYSFRELDRQISSGLFERTMIGNAKLSTVLRVLHPTVEQSFKDRVVEYSLNRSLSPTLVSEYKTQLPDKKLLQRKIHELLNRL